MIKKTTRWIAALALTFVLILSSAESQAQCLVGTTSPTDQFACLGTTATFTCSGGLSRQWYKNGVAISGATGTSYTTPAVTAGDNGAIYTVRFVCLFGTDWSDPAVLTVTTTVSITSQPLTQTICLGSPVTFSVAATGGGLSYQWRKNGINIGGATASSYTIASTVAGSAGTFSVIVTNDCGSVTSSNATLTISTPPTINTQPASATRCAGTSVTFTVAATGTGLTYQWKKNGTDIGSATATSYTISSPVAGDAGNYTVVVTSGACSVTSSTAVLTVNALPAITAQPTAASTVCVGSPASFTVSATGTGLNYQWRKNGSNMSNGGTISGVNTATLSISSAVSGDAATYTVVISGTCTPSVTSSNAVLAVNTAPAITGQPVTLTRCVGVSATFTVTATGTNLTYQWRKNGVNMSNGGTISGVTTATLSISSVAAGDAANYSVVVSNTGCTSATSSSVALTVNTAPGISGQPVSITRCIGSNAAFTVTPTGTNLTYQWRKNGVNMSNGGSISGVNTTTLVITGVVAGDAANYDVIISNTGCTSVTSSAAALTLQTPPSITAQPVASQTICAGNNATFSVTATGTGLSYQWKKGATNIGTNSNTLTINNISATDAGIYTVIVSGTCTPSVTSNNSLLLVNLMPTITIQPAPQAICAGLPVAFSVSASGTGIAFQWQKNGVNIGGATSTSLNIASASASDAGTYSVVINGTCATTNSSNAALTVNTTNVWSGVGASWTTGSNWSCGAIPTSALDVTIPTGVSFYPVVPAGATASVRNLTIDNGASLTLNSNTSTMQVYGDWTNNGTFAPNTGTIAFNGSTAQTIAGNTTTDFYNLNINNTAAVVSLNQNANLQGTLTLGANSNFTTTGHTFTLISNASGTGRIGAVPASAAFNGDLNIQRYIPAKAGRYWYQLATPVAGTMVGHWQQAFAITGVFWGASNPGNGINQNGASMYAWGAGTGLWQRFPNSSYGETFTPGTGYRTFVRDGNASYNGGATATKTFYSTGTPTIGNFNFTLPYNPVGGTPAGGWNLIGNPYPSDINGDLNHAGWTSKVNLDGLAIYQWDSDAQAYVSCNGGVGACTVPSSQAFWVKVNPGGGSLTASENVKSATSLTIYKVASEEPNYIPVKIINNATHESDVLYLRFEEDATTGFDNHYDAYKLIMSASGVVGNSVSLYSQMNTINYSIMARPVPTENDTIPLTIQGPSGNHSLDFSDDSHLQAAYSYYLIDKAENSVTDLRTTKIYDFHITGQVSSYENRFYIVFKVQEEEQQPDDPTDPGHSTTGNTDATESADVTVYPNPVTSENIQVTIPENISGIVKVSIVDMKGTEVFSEKREVSSTLSVSLGKKLKGGVYMLQIESDGKQYRKKIIVQ